MLRKLKADDTNFSDQRVISIEGSLAFSKCNVCGVSYTISTDDFAAKVCDSPRCIKTREAS